MIENILATIIGGVCVAIIVGLWALAAKSFRAYHRLAMPLSRIVGACMFVVIGWTTGSLYTFGKVAIYFAPEHRTDAFVAGQMNVWTAIWIEIGGTTMLAYLLFLSFLPLILHGKRGEKT